MPRAADVLQVRRLFSQIENVTPRQLWGRGLARCQLDSAAEVVPHDDATCTADLGEEIFALFLSAAEQGQHGDDRGRAEREANQAQKGPTAVFARFVDACRDRLYDIHRSTRPSVI